MCVCGPGNGSRTSMYPKQWHGFHFIYFQASRFNDIPNYDILRHKLQDARMEQTDEETTVGKSANFHEADCIIYKALTHRRSIQF